MGDESVDKPDSVPTASGRRRSSICDRCCQRPGAIYPEARASSPRVPPQTRERVLLILLRVGFTEPPQSPGVLVVSYTTVSPLPPIGQDQHPRPRGGGLFSVALSRGLPRVGVTHHPALWSPDFPRPPRRRPRSPDRLVPSSAYPGPWDRPSGRAATRVRSRARIAPRFQTPERRNGTGSS